MAPPWALLLPGRSRTRARLNHSEIFTEHLLSVMLTQEERTEQVSECSRCLPWQTDHPRRKVPPDRPNSNSVWTLHSIKWPLLLVGNTHKHAEKKLFNSMSVHIKHTQYANLENILAVPREINTEIPYGPSNLIPRYMETVTIYSQEIWHTYFKQQHHSKKPKTANFPDILLLKDKQSWQRKEYY